MSDYGAGRYQAINRELIELTFMTEHLKSQGEVLQKLVEFAELEHEARRAAEASARRWAWVGLALAVLTLIAAVAGLVVSTA